MSSGNISIRELSEADIAAADLLRQKAGWNQTHADWLRTIRYEPRGCFAAVRGDEIVGTVTTTTYGTALGWIGMMLVREDCRRQGIATALMTQALDYLNSRKIECIKLDATPVGLPVYGRLGFRAEWQFHRWAHAGHSLAERDGMERTGTEGFYAEDIRAFGVDRSEWLRRVAADSIVVHGSDGFGMLRPGTKADYLGPVSAMSDAAAERIIGQLLSQSGSSVFWHIV